MNFFAKAGARILENKIIHDGWSRFHQLVIEYTSSEGRTFKLPREVVDHGPATAILLYDPKCDRVVLVRQFRMAAFFVGRPAFMLEVPAGLTDGDSPEEAVRRETAEETGYEIGHVEYIWSMFPSAGQLTEEVHCYLGIIDAEQRVSHGGGLEEEHEDIEIVELGLDEAYAMIASHEINDAKTIMLLQWAMLNRERLKSVV